MSTTVGKIIVAIGADVSELTSGFNSALKSLGSFGAMAAKVAGVGAALGGAMAIVDRALKAQAEQESAINRLNLALANQGRYTDEVSQRLQNYANHIQATTTFSDEAVLAVESLLASFGQTGAQIETTTGIIADFSAATGTDLEAAANLVGKAFVGSTAALSRYGITIDEGLSRSEKFAAVTEQLASRFGGAAAAATATYSGQLKMLGNSFDEAEQALGKLLGQVLGSSTPFGGLIPAVNAVTTFIGRDLVIALGEARAQFSEFAASALESVAGLLGKLESLPVIGSKFAGLKDGLLAFAGGLRSSAEGFRSESDAAAVAAGKTLTFANAATRAGQGLHELTDAQKKAIAAAKEWAGQVETLMRQLSGSEARDEMLKLTVAFIGAGGASGLTSKQFEDLHGRVLDLVAAGAQIPPVMQQAGLAITQSLGKQTNIADPFPRSTKTILDLWHATDGVKKATTDWSKELADLSHSFELLGVTADSALGRVLGGLTAGAAALSKMGELNKGKGGFLGALTGAQGIGSIVPAIGAALQAGAAAFQVGKAIFGLFHSSPAERAAKEAGQLLGMKVSKELAESILKTSKDLHVSINVATLLNLDKAMGEAGGPAAAFAGQVSKLMEGVASGAIPAKQGLEQIGKAFTAIKDEAMAAGHVGDATMVGLIKRARELGQTTPEMAAFVGEQVDLAISGLDRLIGKMAEVADSFQGKDAGLTLFGGDSAAMQQNAMDQASIFMAVFNATLAEKGMAGAVEALGPMFDVLKEKLAILGQTTGTEGALAILAPFERLQALMANDIFRGAAEGAGALKDIMSGLANAGYLDIATFQALQNQAMQSFGVMTDQGATTKEALLTLAPTIQTAISAAQQFGVPLSADMQKLKEMAEQNGITFKTDPMERMATALEAIAVKLGALPAEILKVGDAFGNINPPTISIPFQFVEVGGGLPGEGGGGTNGHPGGGGGGNYQGGHASGYDAIARSDGYLKFHRGERVNVTPVNGESPMSREIAGQVAAMLGGGGTRSGGGNSDSGGAPVDVRVPVMLDGKALGEAFFQMSKDGRVRVSKEAVVSY